MHAHLDVLRTFLDAAEGHPLYHFASASLDRFLESRLERRLRLWRRERLGLFSLGQHGDNGLLLELVGSGKSGLSEVVVDGVGVLDRLLLVVLAD